MTFHCRSCCSCTSHGSISKMVWILLSLYWSAKMILLICDNSRTRVQIFCIVTLGPSVSSPKNQARSRRYTAKLSTNFVPIGVWLAIDTEEQREARTIRWSASACPQTPCMRVVNTMECYFRFPLSVSTRRGCKEWNAVCNVVWRMRSRGITQSKPNHL